MFSNSKSFRVNIMMPMDTCFLCTVYVVGKYFNLLTCSIQVKYMLVGIPCDIQITLTFGTDRGQMFCSKKQFTDQGKTKYDLVTSVL